MIKLLEMHSLAHAGVFVTALEHHRWPRNAAELLDQCWIGPAIQRMLDIVNPQLAIFRIGREQQGLTWEQLINTTLDKLWDTCLCPG